ncbi:hypothetical protein F5884DRAFT_10810 [Xylogone sp. PMI_703]|nr:hypothetical protein F5884DRAFT_10810 [Xylogone sp. PMI_703]
MTYAKPRLCRISPKELWVHYISKSCRLRRQSTTKQPTAEQPATKQPSTEQSAQKQSLTVSPVRVHTSTSPTTSTSPSIVSPVRGHVSASPTTPTTPSNPHPTRLLDLPVDIIICIADHLPPQSAALFAYVCKQASKQFRLAIGSRYDRKLRKQKKHEKFCEYLEIIGREMPGKIACCHCKMYHDIAEAKAHLPNHRTICSFSNDLSLEHYRACEIWDSGNQVNYFLSKGFSTVIFRMAMKQYREGREFEHLFALLSETSEQIAASGCCEYTSKRFRIENGRLILRELNIYYFPLVIEDLRNGPLYITGAKCPHGSVCGKWNPARNTIGNFVGRFGQVQRCKDCHKDFRVDMKQIPESKDKCGTCMVLVTSWKDLGEGVLCNDPVFLSHIRYKDHLQHRQINHTCHQLGSIAEAFEHSESFEVDRIVKGELLDRLHAKATSGAWTQAYKAHGLFGRS